MPATLTTWGRQALLRTALRQETQLASPMHMALTRTVPTATTTTAQLTEPGSGINYARQQVLLGTANWTVGGDGSISYNPSILFSPPTGDWGLILGWAIVSGTNVFGVGTMVIPRRIGAGVRVRIAAGAIKFGLYD